MLCNAGNIDTRKTDFHSNCECLIMHAWHSSERLYVLHFICLYTELCMMCYNKKHFLIAMPMSLTKHANLNATICNALNKADSCRVAKLISLKEAMQEFVG